MGFSNGGASDLDLSFLFCPFLPFLGRSRFFRDFPDLSGDSQGISPICRFPLSRPMNSAYEEQSRKGPRHNLDLSRKKWETPRFGNPPVWLLPNCAQIAKSGLKPPFESPHLDFPNFRLPRCPLRFPQVGQPDRPSYRATDHRHSRLGALDLGPSTCRCCLAAEAMVHQRSVALSVNSPA